MHILSKPAFIGPAFIRPALIGPALIVAGLLFTGLVTAQEGQAQEGQMLQPLPEAPPPPDPVLDGEIMEPAVTIVNKVDSVVEEYRLNGKLYLIKITPRFGKPYYLLDNDGDGQLETRMSAIYSGFAIPQWVLFSW